MKNLVKRTAILTFSAAALLGAGVMGASTDARADHRYYKAPYHKATYVANKKIEKRQANQRKRIRHGIRNGSLTRYEARHLFRAQHRIERMQRLAMRDGVLNRYERKRIFRALKREHRHIYRQKHDHQTRRYVHYGYWR